VSSLFIHVSEGNFIQLGYQQTHKPVPLLRDKAPLVSGEVEAVVMKALAKDLHQRFATVQAFSTALEQASQSGQSQPAVLLTPVTPPSQSEQSQPSVSLPEATSSKQFLPPTVTITPPNQNRAKTA